MAHVLYRIYRTSHVNKDDIKRCIAQVNELGLPDATLELEEAGAQITLWGPMGTEFDRHEGILGYVGISAISADAIPEHIDFSNLAEHINSVWEFHLTADRNPLTESALWNTFLAFAEFVEGWYWIYSGTPKRFASGQGTMIDLGNNQCVIDRDRLLDFALRFDEPESGETPFALAGRLQKLWEDDCHLYQETLRHWVDMGRPNLQNESVLLDTAKAMWTAGVSRAFWPLLQIRAGATNPGDLHIGGLIEGDYAKATILIVGMNPHYEHKEVHPSAVDSFERGRAFFTVRPVQALAGKVCYTIRQPRSDEEPAISIPRDGADAYRGVQGTRIPLYESGVVLADQLGLSTSSIAYCDAIRYKSVGSQEVKTWRKFFPEEAMTLREEALHDFTELLQAMGELRVVVLCSDALKAFWPYLTGGAEAPSSAKHHGTVYPKAVDIPGTDRKIRLVSSVLLSARTRGWHRVPEATSFEEVLMRLVAVIRPALEIGPSGDLKRTGS